MLDVVSLFSLWVYRPVISFIRYLKQIYTCSILKALRFIQKFPDKRMLNLATRGCEADKLRPVLNKRVISIPSIRKHQY